jgi:hypothetical protein
LNHASLSQDFRSVKLALIAIAAVVFSVLVAVVHTVSQRRHERHVQEQWEARERSLNRKP